MIKHSPVSVMTMPFRRLIFRAFLRFQAFFSVKERSSIFRDEETKYFRGPHHMCKRYTHSKKRLCSLSGNFRPFLLQRQKSLIYAKSKAGKVGRAEKKERKEGKGKQKRGKKEEQGKKRKRGKRGKEQNGKDEKSEKKKNGKKQGEQEKTEKRKKARRVNEKSRKLF